MPSLLSVSSPFTLASLLCWVAYVCPPAVVMSTLLAQPARRCNYEAKSEAIDGEQL